MGGRGGASGATNSGAPGTKMSGNGYSFKVDHVDSVGGIFSYEGSAGGYTIGKTYESKSHTDIGGEPSKMTAASIHVYPNGKGQVLFNGTRNGIYHFNETYDFKVGMPDNWSQESKKYRRR